MKYRNILGSLVVLTALFSVLSIVPGVMAYDASTPYTVTLQWIIPADTSFTVALCGAESSIDFDTNVVNGTDNGVEPDCQDDGGSTPMLTITNTGNVNLNFTTNLTTGIPGWATLYVDNDNTIAGSDSFNTTAVLVEGGVASSGTVDVYFWTDYASAPAGTTQRTLQINSLAETP